MKQETAMPKRAARERGIALITVILLLLVLTVLGIAASVLMTRRRTAPPRVRTSSGRRCTRPRPGCGAARPI